MCTKGSRIFAAEELKHTGADACVLEVGSYDVNGSVRELYPSSIAKSYVGVDIAPGPGVDVVWPAERLVERFGLESFDVVVSTEMLEHVADWRLAVAQMKLVLRRGGRLILTTRSPGFGLHGFPADFWRFTPHDMRVIFADLDDVCIEADAPESPGVFVSGRKSDRPMVSTAALTVYSVVTRMRRERATMFDRVASRILVAGKSAAPMSARRVGHQLGQKLGW